MTLPEEVGGGPRILLLATCDTKLEEITYVHDRLTQLNPKSNLILMDVGRSEQKTPSQGLIKVNQTMLFAHDHPPRAKNLPQMSRDEYSTAMISAGTRYVRRLHAGGPLHGVLGVGGSTGSSIVAALMRGGVPIGVPKLLVSTMASGDVGPLVGGADLTLMYSVTDIAGLNFLSERILGNAAAAISGMAGARFDVEGRARNHHDGDRNNTKESGEKHRKNRIAITMFGVTTPGVDAIRSILTQSPHNAEVIVFHATGAGGKAMEALIREGSFDAIVDLTTTEVADEIGGGVLSAGPERLLAGAEAGVPMVVSVGACDMVNFGPKETMRAEHLDAAERGERKLYVHNPMVTLLRTTKDENRRIAEFMVEKLRRAQRKDLVKVIIPMGAVSMISGKGGPFEDREADEELFSGIEKGLRGSGIEVLRVDELEINDEQFAQKVVDVLVELQNT
ncbi:UPF0261 domain protein [Truncatella angustata]|uniref:UPF0261 domain protein n=1 Tax=Truncatella angustata TaxID=152316 RepID=A0A9P8RHY3_9PEZI|nr:UPF0261 domain protein [Truncatella angustata]KAH6646353.1 UPF0261 domain protein [Truncatella angustata]